MFKFWIYNSVEDDIKSMIMKAKNMAIENGCITFEGLRSIFSWANYDCDIPVNCRDGNRYMWGYHELIDIGFTVDLAIEAVVASDKSGDHDLTRITIPNPIIASPLEITKSSFSAFPSMIEPDDDIEMPHHYVEGRKYEPRKVIYDWALNFNLGSAVKYIARAGRKGDAVKDLRKAIKFIEFEIEEIEEARGDQNDQG